MAFAELQLIIGNDTLLVLVTISMADKDMKDVYQDEASPISLDILQFIKIGQSQHGLRHNDFARYRQHCTKKGQRLRKSIKLQQGRGKFVRKKLELTAVTSPAHLQLPLISAERSWAWAMESKALMEGSHAAVMRQHMLRRLAKASRHAADLSRFACARGDSRTALEAEAYAAHIAGLHLLEHADRKAAALSKLQRAEGICAKLAKVGTFEQQAVAQQRLDEIEPLTRFAKYQLKQGDSSALPDESAVAEATIEEKLASLEAENSGTVGPPTSKASAAGPAYLQWRGETYTAFGERLKGFIGQTIELAPKVEQAQAGGNPDEQLSLLEKLIAAFSEAKGVVRHSLATSGGTAEAADAVADLKAFNVAVSGKQLELTVQKNLLVAAQAEKRLESNAQPLDAAVKPKRSKGKKVKGHGPLAVVRIYDTLLGNVRDLTEIASQLGGAAGEYLLDECNAQSAEFRAQRCFFLARSYLTDAKPREARALFSRAEERAAEALTQHEDCARPNAAAIKALEELKLRAGAWGIVAHARALAADEQVAQDIKDMKLAEDGIRDIPVKYLLDDLESWTSYAGSETEPARLAPLPPRLQPIAARPFLLDCALNYIKPPDLSHRLPKEEKKSTIGRLFGWGTSK